MSSELALKREMRTPDVIADDAKEKTSKTVSKQSVGLVDLEFAAFLACR